MAWPLGIEAVPPTHRRPRCLILAGPNGAGKTTHASGLVHEASGIATYINTDVIAAGLAGASLQHVAFEAGRLALRAIDDGMRRRSDFAFETTLSGRRWPALLDRLRDAGYDVLLHYLWIRDVDQCMARVARRATASPDSWVPSAATVEAHSRTAVRRALAIHRALGVEAVWWEDGQLMIIPPEALPRDVNDLDWTERMLARQRRGAPADASDRA